ncbi:glycosyltransferase family 2 protein [Pedobacter sp. MC2016-14]|uniref:glycosyltransferase family 2 protein n=1 Tax=Pedobacter sp. MC2016-14 TaxID=2897327 RepID=UPI001E45B69D|nr:glycosyltransferase family 2 protein [Pedobacter sp. MC2016-14]MCD0490006.1 glycosyltransferase family 2 protein [Pedobacter sp. MC2016-14]
MTTKPSVAIVILNWNGITFLQRFLPGVLQSSYSNLQVVVGDNASTDGSLAMIREYFPSVKIIENEANFGFAEGYNKVLKQVDADYFILLNSDVEVPQNWIEPVISAMELDDRIAAAQPKIKWYNDKAQFEYAGAAGGFLDQYVFPFCRGRIFDVAEFDHGQYNDAAEIFWASGAAFFIKRKCWEEVGGLDPDLFAHMEEIDICWRLKNLGYAIIYCPDAEVYHVGGGTLNATNPFKTYLNFRNNLFIMQKNLPFFQACYLIFIRFFIDFVALLQFLFTGKANFAKAVSKAHIQFFKHFFRTAGKRTSKQLPYQQHTGVYQKSIVWAYFIRKARKFSQL